MLYLEFARRQRVPRWSQERLSKATGIPRHFISAIERQEIYPTPDQLKRLADVLGLPPELVLRPVEPAALKVQTA